MNNINDFFLLGMAFSRLYSRSERLRADHPGVAEEHHVFVQKDLAPENPFATAFLWVKTRIHRCISTYFPT